MDGTLSKRLRSGDEAALAEAIDRYSPYAAKIITAYLNRALSPEDIEEVLSDVFVSLWNSRQNMQGEIRPYLAAIARNAARQKLRSFHPALPLSEDDTVEDDRPLPQELAESAEQAALLQEALSKLAPELQQLFIRRYYLEQTVAEIAAVTGENASTLRSRLRRGRLQLREILTKRGGIDV